METLNKIKLAVVGIAGAITAVFGWMGWLVIGFAACMLLDWITGSAAGSKKDGWSSATARAGLWHKGGMLVVVVPFPVSWTVKMKKKQKETQDILSYHSQAAGCSDKARAKASGGRQPIEECGRTGL